MELPGGVPDEEQQQRARLPPIAASSDGGGSGLSIRTSSGDVQPSPERRSLTESPTTPSDVPTPASAANRSREVWIGNIGAADANDEALRAALSKFGSVQNVTVRPVEEDKGRTWGLVTFATLVE
eukprot:COSAG06_NODE_38089_length_427_cov_1.405488_1_plen_124_part_01